MRVSLHLRLRVARWILILAAAALAGGAAFRPVNRLTLGAIAVAVALTWALAEMFALGLERYAVMAVQHCHIPPPGPKMDGQVNRAYARKNWSSLMLFNCAHAANAALSAHAVSNLHRDHLHGLR